MNNMVSLVSAVKHFLEGFPSSFWREVCEPARDERHRKGQKWGVFAFLANGVLGKLCGARTLRILEHMTEWVSRRRGGPGFLGKRRMPDSTFHDWLEQSSAESCYRRMVAFASQLHRRKMLTVTHGVQIGENLARVLSFDGKVSFRCDTTRTEEERSFKSYKTKEKQADGSVVEKKHPYTTVDTLRCIDASAAGPICIGLLPIWKGDEVAAAVELDRRLFADCRWLRGGAVVVTGDARHGNQEFARQQGDPYGEIDIPGHGHFYALKIKGNAGAIYTEGLRALQAKIDRGAMPEAVEDWQDQGHGRSVKRELFRVDTTVGREIEADKAWTLEDGLEVAVLNPKEWPTVRQIIGVRQSLHHKTPPSNGTPQDSKELRLMIVNIKKDDCSPSDLLRLLRLEWQVEVHHNVLDVVLHEDKGEWASSGHSPLGMATLHSMAANLLILLKKRTLRSEGHRESLSYGQLQFVLQVVLMGNAVFEMLRQNARKVFEDQLDASREAFELPDEFRRQWSDAEVAELLSAVALLFGYLGKHLAGIAKKIQLTLILDIESCTMTKILQVD